MAYVLKEIFGDTKRISILEELVERWGEFLKVSELVRMSGASKKTVYEHLKELEGIGLLETKDGRATLYKLKEDDGRSLALAMLESNEYLRKTDINILRAEKDEEIIEMLQSFEDVYKSGTDRFGTEEFGTEEFDISSPIQYSSPVEAK